MSDDDISRSSGDVTWSGSSTTASAAQDENIIHSLSVSTRSISKDSNLKLVERFDRNIRRAVERSTKKRRPVFLPFLGIVTYHCSLVYLCVSGVACVLDRLNEGSGVGITLDCDCVRFVVCVSVRNSSDITESFLDGLFTMITHHSSNVNRSWHTNTTTPACFMWFSRCYREPVKRGLDRSEYGSPALAWVFSPLLVTSNIMDFTSCPCSASNSSDNRSKETSNHVGAFGISCRNPSLN